jgi:hypothetical protein
MNLAKLAVIVIILAGIGLIITAFIDSPVQLPVASALVGVGFICLGLLQVRNFRDKKLEQEGFKQIMAKIEQIEKEFKGKAEKSKGTGVVIADIINSGLKYYTEHLSGSKEGEKND